MFAEDLIGRISYEVASSRTPRILKLRLYLHQAAISLSIFISLLAIISFGHLMIIFLEKRPFNDGSFASQIRHPQGQFLELNFLPKGHLIRHIAFQGKGQSYPPLTSK